METFEKIIEQYTQSEVCMGELLANISADGMSIEDAFELYIKAMNYAEKVKRTIKGNRVDVKKVLAFHVMSAKSDLPGSRIWVKIN